MGKCENAKMIKSKEIAGYVLGGVMFVVLLPTIMWLASGMPALEHIGASRAAITGMLILGGLAVVQSLAGTPDQLSDGRE